MTRVFFTSVLLYIAKMEFTAMRPLQRPNHKPVYFPGNHLSSLTYKPGSLGSPALKPILASTGSLTFTRSRVGSMPQIPSVTQLVDTSKDSTDSIIQQHRSALERYKAERRSNGEQGSKPATWPMTSAVAIERFGNQLSHYERMEMMEYQHIYYLGLGAKKLPTSLSLPNNGFDDDHGDYRVFPNDHIAYRYEIVALLGKGNFGIVLRCFDHKQRESIALKILRTHKRLTQQGTTEIRILELIRDNDIQDNMHIVHLKDHFKFRKHTCLTFELLGNDLLEVIKTNNYLGLAVSYAKEIACQLLTCLKFLSSMKIIHCDIKPENILLKNNKRQIVKLIDLGSACFESSRLFAYIQSRFYRAPEVILGSSYSYAIDMWSLGCVLAEVCTGRPLFRGEDEREQLQAIMEVLGPPPEKFVEKCSRKGVFFDESGELKLGGNSTGRVRNSGQKTWEEAVPGVSIHMLDFLRQCLQWDPALRMTPEEGLAHPWVVG